MPWEDLYALNQFNDVVSPELSWFQLETSRRSASQPHGTAAYPLADVESVAAQKQDSPLGSEGDGMNVDDPAPQVASQASKEDGMDVDEDTQYSRLRPRKTLFLGPGQSDSKIIQVGKRKEPPLTHGGASPKNTSSRGKGVQDKLLNIGVTLGSSYDKPIDVDALSGEQRATLDLQDPPIKPEYKGPGDISNSSDAEPGYVHFVAPDPRRLEPLDNPRIMEQGCFAITEQKKFYEFKNKESPVFVKRNLTPSEYGINWAGELIIPYFCKERMKNEVAAIRYVQDLDINIPTPNIRCAFEDHGRYYYIITDTVPGVPLTEIPDDKKALVINELEGYLAQLHSIKSKVMGNFLGDVIVPPRIKLPHDQVLKMRKATTPEFVLCHNDLGQHNIMVDESTFKIIAILDWEFAGFYPPEFEGAFYLRPGTSAALKGEENDVPKLLELLEYWKA